jgi:large subunit ribosomal protein L25
MATAFANNTVDAQLREATDKNAARRLRRTGLIPAALYGAGEKPVTIAVDPRQISRVLNSASGHNTIIDVKLESGACKAILVDWQRDPVKEILLHVDLKRIDMNKKMHAEIPVHVKGEAPGVKNDGGLLDIVLREVEIECLPGDIPEAITVDISALGLNQAIRVADLPKSDKIKYLSDADMTVVHVTMVKEEAAPVEAAAAEATAAEPEVMKKGKPEAAETEAAPKKK